MANNKQDVEAELALGKKGRRSIDWKGKSQHKIFCSSDFNFFSY